MFGFLWETMMPREQQLLDYDKKVRHFQFTHDCKSYTKEGEPTLLFKY